MSFLLKTRLKISAALIIAIVILFIAGLMYTQVAEQQAEAGIVTANNFINGLFSMNSHLQDFISGRSERSRVQLMKSHDNLRPLLIDAYVAFPQSEVQQTLNRINDNYSNMTVDLIYVLRNDDPLARERASQILIQSQSTLDDALELSRFAQQRQQNSLRLIAALGILLSVAGGLIVFFISQLVQNLLVSLRGLESRIEDIAMGYLDNEVEVTGKDELAHVMLTFNDMAKKLQGAYSNLHERVTELAALKTRDEAMLRSVGDGLVATDAEGRVMMINDAAQQMLGWKEHEVIGKRFTDIVPTEDEKGNMIPQEKRPLTITLKTGTVISFATTYYLRKDKSKFPVGINIAPIMIDGAIAGVIEVFRDVTKEKEIDWAKSEFVSLASHQLKTPPTAIKLLTERI